MKKSKIIAILLIVASLLTGYAFAEGEPSEGVVIDVNDPNTIASEVLTYDQLLQTLMENEGVNYSQAVDILGPRPMGRANPTYRTITHSVPVATDYKPTVNFYCETSEYGNYWGVLKIKNTSYNRSFGNISKQFSGEIYVDLQSAYKIFLIVNGDYYNSGTTTVSAGIEVGVGELGQVTFTLTKGADFYTYKYYSNTIVLQK